MVNIMVIDPEEYKSKCSEIEILYGCQNSPFGECLIGITGSERAVCFLWFVDDNYNQCLNILEKEWPGAKLIEDLSVTEKIAEKVFSSTQYDDVSVLLRGTDFQVKVWKALMKVPRGEIATYTEIAEMIGSKGVRAAGTAMKSNRICFLVPCHRVVSKTGVNKYRWGPERKDKILDFEKKTA